jgi:surface antigen
MPYNENSQNSRSEGLQIPGLVQNQDAIEQLSFANNATTPLPASTTLQLERDSSPDITDANTQPQPASNAVGVVSPLTPAPDPLSGSTRELLLRSQPAVTRALTNTLSNSNTNALRPPVVIRGNGKSGRSSGLRPPQGRRHVIGLAAVLLLMMITGGTLFAVSPLGRDGGLNFGPLSAGSNLIRENGANNLNLMAQQATATAVIHQQTDGFQPGAPTAGGPVVTGSPESWPVGVCTYWANLRYHELTGFWVTWIGNAYQWADGAREAGWNVSTTPHVPSIVVLMPGVEGASSFGHVAVVESASGNTVHTSNMNWFENGGGFDIVSYTDFTAGPGVYFIWA